MDDNNLYGIAQGLDQRGKHQAFGSALDAAFQALIKEENPFFDLVADNWKRMFPALPVVPGRSDSGVIVLYVKNAGILFMMKQHEAKIKKVLSALKGAPKRLSIRFEVHR